MIQFTHKIKTDQVVELSLTLPLNLRQKSRQRVELDNGAEAALMLKRGTVLYDDDILEAENGSLLKIKAAKETLSEVRCTDFHLYARACYHLGNRHMTIQIQKDRLLYLHDHVLDDMLRGLGLEVQTISEPFEPEPGAYGGSSSGAGGHGHAH